MQIILLRTRSTAAKSVTLTHRHLLLAMLMFVVIVVVSAFLLSYVTFRHAADLKLPFVQDMANSSSQDDAGKKDKFLKENLAAMASKLGEMEAQLMRLDALGERVQGLAGVKPEQFNFKDAPARGSPESSGASNSKPAPPPPPPTDKMPRDLSMTDFQKNLNTVALDIENRSDYMNVVETTLMNFKVRSKLLPTIQPVNVAYNASGFGWRTDPFTGHSAFHEGIDFPSPVGTPIVAAAGGVVIAAEYHHDYGNMLEIDHGNDIVTRHAHTSKILVNVGDIVRRGQHVADIGSTGRSTGAHLHFEVLVKGIQQDPHKFLSAGAEQARILMTDSDSLKVATVATR
ncbi:MAG TPA: M23 family metallopeptidase [Burkholderiaceae bacterium]|nr:M23 family metallopeptidase [Burkholderiaceae bacterium]